MSNPNPGFIPESWALYGVGAAFVILRMIGRVRRVGVRGLQLDDAFIMFGFLSYTLLCVSFNQMLMGAGSNLMTAEEEAALTPEIIEDRVRGSKWVFVSEHAMLLTIWSMKAAMLILYARVTEGLRARKLLNGVIVWVICAFIGDELALFLICRPLSQYWAVPPANIQCATYEYYQIVNAVFNISTDLLILGVGIPPVMNARLSLQQKLVLGIIFGMGSFVIVAAVLRAIYCLVPALISYVYMNWYFREASVAVYVTTLPGIWIFLREVFPALQTVGSRNRSKAQTSRTDPHQWRDLSSSKPRRDPLESKDEYDLDRMDDTWPISKTGAISTAEAELGRDAVHKDSISNDAASSISSSGRYNGNNKEIRRDVTFTVEHIPMGDHRTR